MIDLHSTWAIVLDLGIYLFRLCYGMEDLYSLRKRLPHHSEGVVTRVFKLHGCAYAQTTRPAEDIYINDTVDE